jgi:hypothetical protein
VTEEEKKRQAKHVFVHVYNTHFFIYIHTKKRVAQVLVKTNVVVKRSIVLSVLACHSMSPLVIIPQDKHLLQERDRYIIIPLYYIYQSINQSISQSINHLSLPLHTYLSRMLYHTNIFHNSILREHH